MNNKKDCVLWVINRNGQKMFYKGRDINGYMLFTPNFDEVPKWCRFTEKQAEERARLIKGVKVGFDRLGGGV